MVQALILRIYHFLGEKYDIDLNQNLAAKCIEKLYSDFTL